MSDGFDPNPATGGHPSAHLRAAPTLDEGTTRPPGPLSAVFPADADLPTDVVSYGPDIANESVFRLLGNLEGKRVLELGVAGGATTIAMARQGAHVVAVDPSLHRIEQARLACDRAELKAELHQSDLAEVAFVRADTIDAVVAVYSLAGVEDLDRVFRQVHRVLRPLGPLVLSLPHPAYVVAKGGSYFDNTPVPFETVAGRGAEHPRTISEVFTSLGRANFRVDTLLEPEPGSGPRSAFWEDTMSDVPATFVIRARKEGL